MWEKLRVVFSIEELWGRGLKGFLNSKIKFTLMLLAIYRIGWHIPLPFINQDSASLSGEGSNGLTEFIDKVALFAASDLRQATIFGLGIMPYISASIIFQLLGSVYPPIEALKKEGESGRKKINEYTRYLTVVLCLFQSWAYLKFTIGVSEGLVSEEFQAADGTSLYFGWTLVSVLTMTCGTVFLMWLGEQIDEHGIGNGSSLLIMAGILARMPQAMSDMIREAKPELGGLQKGEIGVETLIVLVCLFLSVVAGVVFITLGQRRIPTQSAKHVRGRRVYGGQRQFLPLKVNQAGVMPIIFASSLLMLPSLLFNGLSRIAWPSGFNFLASLFGSGTSFTYNLLYVMMIFFFCYFWTAITFNPKEMAENLKDYGTFIPGHRPGKRTEDYLEKVMLRITYVGAGFLALVAIVPTIVSGSLGVNFRVASFYGGTGLLIAVSVAFDLVQKIDSHLVMRNYKGLLEG